MDKAMDAMVLLSDWVGFLIEFSITAVVGDGPTPPTPRNPHNRNLLASSQSEEAAPFTAVVQHATRAASRIQGCCEDLAALYQSVVVTSLDNDASKSEEFDDENGWEFVDGVDDGSPSDQGLACDAQNETETVDVENDAVLVSHYLPSDATLALEKMVTP